MSEFGEKYYSQWDNRELLDSFGVNYLTGEACGLSMRGLYDLTPAGAELLAEFLGGCVPQSEAWNGRDGAKVSALLTHATVEDLISYGLCKRHPLVLRINSTYTNGWACFKSMADFEAWREADAGKVHEGKWRVYYASGTAAAGFRNQHVFSGRVE